MHSSTHPAGSAFPIPSADSRSRITVAPSPAARAAVIGVSALIGAAVGWFARLLAGTFLVHVPVIGTAIEIVERVDGWFGGIGLLLVALACAGAGALVASSILGSLTTISVDEHGIYVHDDGETRRWARSQVDRIVLEPDAVGDGILSLRDERDADLQRAELDVSVARVREALESRGWSVEVQPRR